MVNNNLATQNEMANVIQLQVVNGIVEKKEPKRKKNGEVKNVVCNKKAGISSEVYPFYEDEIKSMIDIFNNKIEESKTPSKVEQGERNKLLFIVGINIGIRASDIRTLKWSFFFDDSREWREFYVIQPKKTANKHKFVKLYFNDAVKRAINEFLEKYPVDNLDSYLFANSRGECITVQMMWNIIKNTAKEAGITKNIGTHSLRKTFGYHCWHNADDKDKALIILQMLFNHSTTQMTQKYIGLMDSEIKDMFYSTALGYGYSSQREASKDTELMLREEHEEPLEILM